MQYIIYLNVIFLRKLILDLSVLLYGNKNIEILSNLRDNMVKTIKLKPKKKKNMKKTIYQ